MPTSTFYNLDKIKQIKILDAAIKEFSEKSYTDASINNIIKEASIPRGSFYMYFENKEDLYHTIMHEYKDKINELFKKCFIKNKGDLFDSFIDIYDDITAYILSQQNINFFKNMFFNLNFRNEQSIIPPHKHEDALSEQLKALIDTSKFITNDEYVLADTFDMLLTLLIRKIVITISHDDKAEKMRNRYISQLKIIKYGLYRED